MRSRSLLCALLATALTFAAPARSSPLQAGTPQLQLTLEGLFAQPAAASSRGFGAGLQVGYRLTDQLSLTADAAQFRAPAGYYTSVAAGLSAILDSTPVAPFVSISFAQLGPESITGSGLATRTSLGADWKIAPLFSLGLEVRTLTPLSTSNGVLVSGTEIALRIMFLPSLFRY